jgi:hypothetical protein
MYIVIRLVGESFFLKYSSKKLSKYKVHNHSKISFILVLNYPYAIKKNVEAK